MSKARMLKIVFLFFFITGSSAFATRTSRVTAQGSCPTQKDHYKIGFANLATGIDFTTAVEAGMKSAAAKAGNIDLVIANNNLDGATALNNAENFLTQGVDGVVEFQTDEKFGNVIMDKFRSQTPPIPVIAIDIPMPGATFFGADNYHAGRLAGEAAGDYAVKNWSGKVDYIPYARAGRRHPVQAENPSSGRSHHPSGQQEHPGCGLQGRQRRTVQDSRRCKYHWR